jgi:hypothetical protein
MALSLQQRAHQPPGGFGVAPTLHENVEHETILINSAPEPVFLATDRNDDFVEVPFVAEPTSRTPADAVGEVPAEFLRPEPDRLVGDNGTMSRQHVLDHAQAEREAEVKPHSMGITSAAKRWRR